MIALLVLLSLLFNKEGETYSSSFPKATLPRLLSSLTPKTFALNARRRSSSSSSLHSTMKRNNTSSAASPSLDYQDFAFFYLQNTLQLSQPALMRIVMKHPSILYLKPRSNLIPTIEVYQSFGFTNKDIRAMVEKVPSVLAINHNWTLPEKLLSLQALVPIL